MPLALEGFDLGSFEGEHAAIDFRHTMELLCMCSEGDCNDATRAQAINDATQFEARKERSTNETIAQIMGRLSSHSCLDGTVAVEIYKTGYACGYIVGIDDPALRKSIEKDFLRVFPGDPQKAYQRAKDCWSGQSQMTPTTPQAAR
jgi:hypothetical protein